jgi:1,2-phenylacetyl-CoA epoxidase PaaB subunit
VTLPTHERLTSYEVFARHDKQPRLRHIGEVQAAGDDDAVVFAYTLYDERRWQEMLVVKRSSVVSLIQPE